MNPLKFIPTFLFFLNTIALSGQTVQFTYDDNGNRLTRSIIVTEVQSASVSFPVNPESLTPKFLDNNSKGANKTDSENAKSENAKSIDSELEKDDVDSEIKVKIYPNPTKGLLRIEVSNMPLESRNEMRLYNMNGNELINLKDFESLTEMNINHLRDGLYILRIKINTQLFDYQNKNIIISTNRFSLLMTPTVWFTSTMSWMTV